MGEEDETDSEEFAENSAEVTENAGKITFGRCLTTISGVLRQR